MARDYLEENMIINEANTGSLSHLVLTDISFLFSRGDHPGRTDGP